MRTLLTHARIVTMDAGNPEAQALVIEGGRILALGGPAAMAELAGPGAEVIDAGGRLVLPGFIDAHVHLMDGGMNLACAANLHGVTSMAELQQALAETAARVPGPLVYGAGWQATWFGDEGITREDLDAAVPDRPCIAYDSSFHLACLNSAACVAVGLDRMTQDPPNGHIVRDAAGRPTGMLHEEAIDWARENGLPAVPDDWYRRGMLHGQAHANAHGITGIVDPAVDDRFHAVYLGLDAEAALTLRVTGSAKIWAGEAVDAVVARLSVLRGESGGDYRMTSAKLFLDGVLENRTAAMLEPYSDAAGGNAPVMFPQGQLDALCTALDAARFQLHFHCIGDGAARAALDAIAAARSANGPWPAAPQIAHCQIVDPADLGRFAELGAAANIQPLWARREEGDESWLAMTGDRTAYPFRSLLEAGAPFCLSSDFPVSTLNPFEIIATAVLRRAPEGGRALHPDQAMSVAQAVAGYTCHGADAAWLGAEAGRLIAGRSADLIVLDRDILTCPAEEIAGTQVLLTLFKGQAVHRAAGF